MSSSSTSSNPAKLSSQWKLSPQTLSSLHITLSSLRASSSRPALHAPPPADALDEQQRMIYDSMIDRWEQKQAEKAEKKSEKSAAKSAQLKEEKSHDDSDDDDDDSDDAAAAADEDDDDEEDEDEDDEDDDDAPESEFDHFINHILCLNAIQHDIDEDSTQLQCPYCQAGKRTSSEFACATCAFVRGVCAQCRKIVVLRQLEDTNKGVAICVGLLQNQQLLEETFDLDPVEDADEIEAIQGQITFMLDAYYG